MKKIGSGFADSNFISQMPNCAWPAIPSNAGAQALALQFQLAQSEWWSPEEIRIAQFTQLRHVLDEAFEKIDYWTDKLRQVDFQPGHSLTDEQFAALPMLTRDDLFQRNSMTACHQHQLAHHGILCNRIDRKTIGD